MLENIRIGRRRYHWTREKLTPEQRLALWLRRTKICRNAYEPGRLNHWPLKLDLPKSLALALGYKTVWVHVNHSVTRGEEPGSEVIGYIPFENLVKQPTK